MSEIYRSRFEAVSGSSSLTHEFQVTNACQKWIARIITLPDSLWTEDETGRPLIFTAATREEVEHQAFHRLRQRCDRNGQRILNLNHDRCVGLDQLPARRFVAMYPVKFQLRLGGRCRNSKFAENTFTANLSETGLFIVTAQRLKPGALLKIFLKLPGRTEKMDGEVAWGRLRNNAGRPLGVGVNLVDPPLSYRTKILTLG